MNFNQNALSAALYSSFYNYLFTIFKLVFNSFFDCSFYPFISRISAKLCLVVIVSLWSLPSSSSLIFKHFAKVNYDFENNSYFR